MFEWICHNRENFLANYVEIGRSYQLGELFFGMEIRYMSEFMFEKVSYDKLWCMTEISKNKLINKFPGFE